MQRELLGRQRECLAVKEEGGKHKDIGELFKKYVDEAEKIDHFVDHL